MLLKIILYVILIYVSLAFILANICLFIQSPFINKDALVDRNVKYIAIIVFTIAVILHFYC